MAGRRKVVSGVVCDAASGAPLGDVVVVGRAGGASGPEIAREDVGADGRFAMPYTEESLTLVVVDRSGRVLHIDAPTAAEPARGGEDLVIGVPLHKHRRDSRGLRLLDGQGRERRELEVGESLLVAFAGGEADALLDWVVLDPDDDVVLTSQLRTDRYGVIEPTVLWPDIGMGNEGGGRWASAADLDMALDQIGGTRFEVAASLDGREMARTELPVSDRLAARRVYASDGHGAPRRGMLADQDSLHVALRNFGEGSLVDVMVVPRQLDWREGDLLAPATALDGRELVERVTVRGPVAVVTMAERGSVAPGAFDLVARVVHEREWHAREPRLRATDLLSDRLLTSLVLRDDVYRHKPVLLGCVNAQREVACKLLPGPPYVEFTNNFPRGTDVWAALDPGGLMPGSAGRKVRFSVIDHRSPTQWAASSSFTPVTGTGAEIVTTSVCINGNRALVWSNPQSPGRYDLVVDFGNNDPNPSNFVPDSSFDPPTDMIDGYFQVGFYVTDDPSLPGPYAVGSTDYDGPAVIIPAPGVWTASGTLAGGTPSGVLSLPLRATVRYPATSAGPDSAVSAAQPTWPVVVVMHGQSSYASSYLGYNYLLDHLASHGMVAVSIDCIEINNIQGMQDTRSHAVLEHLALLQAKNSAGGLLGGHLDLARVVVMGHSRGGDGAVQTEIDNQAQGLGWSIRGVIALAPTDFSGTSPNPTVLASAPLMVLLGSNDCDITGAWGLNHYADGYTGQGFRFFDRATSEKATVYVHGATHNRFNTEWGVEGGVDVGSPRVLSAAQHQDVLRGYVAAFCQIYLQNRAEQREYLTGELKPATVSTVKIYNQHRPTNRRSLDDFESASSTATNSAGGPVSSASLYGSTAEGLHYQLNSHSPHQSRGARLRWSSAAGKYVSTIPAGPQRDISSFRYLSFRIGQGANKLVTLDRRYEHQVGGGGYTYQYHDADLDSGVVTPELRQLLANHGVPLGTPVSLLVRTVGWEWLVSDPTGQLHILLRKSLDAVFIHAYRSNPTGTLRNSAGLAQDLYVRLTTVGGGPSRAVRAGYFAPIPEPFKPEWLAAPDWLEEDATIAPMSTIRIPLNAWTITCVTAPIVNLTSVESVAFEMSLTSTGEVLVDDVEFTA